MQVANTKEHIANLILDLRKTNTSIGFVPTMGALHKGHLSLINKALQENEFVFVSIFVNPTQFENKKDLKNYPRTLNRDIENEMEGEFRDGHFDGVGTIVKRLFEIITPDKAYFGEKDFQQLQIIRKLVEKNNLPVKIIGCKIHREPSGLAMSSRNERLLPEHKAASPFIYKTLQAAKKKFGTKSATKITAWVKKQFENNELLVLEYFIIADIDTLKPVKRKSKSKKYRAFIAVYAGEIRLIDNIALN